MTVKNADNQALTKNTGTFANTITYTSQSHAGQITICAYNGNNVLSGSFSLFPLALEY
jgi:hypothetical protein